MCSRPRRCSNLVERFGQRQRLKHSPDQKELRAEACGNPPEGMTGKGRTRREARLELLCLLGVIKCESVEVARAANLELCACLPACYPGRNLLDARRCEHRKSVHRNRNTEVYDAPEASFRRAMSMNCLMSRISLGYTAWCQHHAYEGGRRRRDVPWRADGLARRRRRLCPQLPLWRWKWIKWLNLISQAA